jgi:mRNA-degrading endonuclease YafQ of YafQ-DinJ toxin-antitoxin module
MFEINLQKYVAKKLQKLLKNNKILQVRFDIVINKISQDPFEVSLRTHKVNSKLFGEKYSSSLTLDLRIIWDFDKTTNELEIIDIFDVGGHSGNNSVY